MHAKNNLCVALTLAFLAGAMMACDGTTADTRVAVIDLTATAKATGEDLVMEQQMESARAELSAQLTQIAGDLEKRLQSEQTRLGGAAKASGSKEFQQFTAQARQQLAQTQALAQQKVQEYQVGLVSRFRQSVQAVAADIARSRGAGVVLAADSTMLWFEPALDITDEVIAALRAKSVDVAPPAVESSSPTQPSSPASSGESQPGN